MMLKNLMVREVNIHGMKGYQITGICRIDSDSFWEDIAHGAVFRKRSRAEFFLKRILTNRWAIQPKYWGKPYGYCENDCDYIQTPVSVYSVI